MELPVWPVRGPRLDCNLHVDQLVTGKFMGHDRKAAWVDAEMVLEGFDEGVLRLSGRELVQLPEHRGQVARQLPQFLFGDDCILRFLIGHRGERRPKTSVHDRRLLVFLFGRVAMLWRTSVAKGSGEPMSDHPSADILTKIGRQSPREKNRVPNY